MLFKKENAIMVLSYDFERLIMSQAATDNDFKHLIDFDDNLLPFRLESIWQSETRGSSVHRSTQRSRR